MNCCRTDGNPAAAAVTAPTHWPRRIVALIQSTLPLIAITAHAMSGDLE